MKKTISILLSAIIAIMSVTSVLSVTAFAQNTAQVSVTANDALHTENYKLVDKNGNDVFLRGLNLGGWLIMEDWFCPVSNDATGDLLTYRTFTERFGVEKTYELINIYQDNWIVESDFKNIADMGFNCVRIPFWYRNFQSDDNGTWILDENGQIDLSRLEWAVEMCRKYGLYAILDLHAANGVQGYTDHAGLKNSYHFFDRNEKGEWYRKQAVELWRVIAERFAGDPAIAMFDLLNEPMCDVPLTDRIHSYIWEYYDMCYDAIRAEDPDRILTMICTWSIDKLPDPDDYGWTDVVYQYHQYDKAKSDYTTRIANGWACFYDVPMYAGEFHPVGDNLELSYAINAYNSNDISWTLWTYKGYNSWAAWSDWFVYGSTSAEYTVDIENDSFEEIAFKWGEAMQTNSGNFKEAKLYKTAKPFIPNATLDSVPFNTQQDVESYVAKPVYKGNGYQGNNTCFLCGLFRNLTDMPLLSSLMIKIHEWIHSVSTSNNIK